MKVLYRVLAEYMAESERKYFMSYKPDEDKIPEVETEIKDTSERDKAVPAEESDFEWKNPIMRSSIILQSRSLRTGQIPGV